MTFHFKNKTAELQLKPITDCGKGNYKEAVKIELNFSRLIIKAFALASFKWYLANLLCIIPYFLITMFLSSKGVPFSVDPSVWRTLRSRTKPVQYDVFTYKALSKSVFDSLANGTFLRLFRMIYGWQIAKNLVYIQIDVFFLEIA